MILTVDRVKYIPEELEEGVLYVSKTFHTAIHLCPCGCRSKVVTPFDKTGWNLTDEADDAISLHPSIGNWQFECKSHYYITNNEIIWT